MGPFLLALAVDQRPVVGGQRVEPACVGKLWSGERDP